MACDTETGGIRPCSPGDVGTALEGLPGDGAALLVGERARLAAFVWANGPKIRAIARRKLSEQTRSWTDSEDIVSSVFLRLDGYLQRGELRYEGLDDLWPLIAVIAERRAIDRSRLAANAKRIFRDLAGGGQLAANIESRPDADATDLVLCVLAKIGSGEDRQLMLLMLRGVRSQAAGELLGMKAPTVRARWGRLRKRLADELREECPR